MTQVRQCLREDLTWNNSTMAEGNMEVQVSRDPRLAASAKRQRTESITLQRQLVSDMGL